VPGIQSVSSPHHQDRYMSGMESVFSPSILVRVRWPNNQSRMPGSIPRLSLWMVYT
jgi:hypothetical protein